MATSLWRGVASGGECCGKLAGGGECVASEGKRWQVGGKWWQTWWRASERDGKPLASEAALLSVCTRAVLPIKAGDNEVGGSHTVSYENFST